MKKYAAPRFTRTRNSAAFARACPFQRPAASPGAKSRASNTKPPQRSNTAHNTADNAAKVFITNAKKRLSKFFGEAYTTEWGAAGWPNNSTGMPSTQAERFSLINSLKLHFTANPAHESADMEVTAALATTLHTTISNARAALDQTDPLTPRPRATSRANSTRSPQKQFPSRKMAAESFQRRVIVADTMPRIEPPTKLKMLKRRQRNFDLRMREE